MASVVEQIIDMDFSGRYRPVLLPITLGSESSESAADRVARHIRQVRLLQATIGRTRAPIVHIHTCSGFSFYRSTVDMLVSQRLGCRTILHIHGARFDEFHAEGNAWRRRLIAWSLSRADRVITLSDGWLEKLRAMAPGARLVVVENAVDIPSSLLTPERALGFSSRGTPLRKDNICRFLLLARMDEWKGIDDLLCACARLHADGVGIELTLAGPPGTAGDARVLREKAAARDLEDVVRYVGPVEGPAKSNLLRWADVYVQPSHHEGMPIALLEALAYGLPVVATRVGAVPEVITDRRQGLLVPPRRPEVLAQAMRSVALDDDRRGAMSHAARALAAERFSITRLRDDLISLYDEIVCKRGTRLDNDHPSRAAAPACERSTSDPLAVLMCSARAATLR